MTAARAQAFKILKEGQTGATEGGRDAIFNQWQRCLSVKTGTPQSIRVTISKGANLSAREKDSLTPLMSDGICSRDRNRARRHSSQYFRSSMLGFFLKRTLLNERLARNKLGWTHSGFSVDLTVKIPASSSKAREALAQYIARPPVSLRKMHPFLFIPGESLDLPARKRGRVEELASHPRPAGVTKLVSEASLYRVRVGA